MKLVLALLSSVIIFNISGQEISQPRWSYDTISKTIIIPAGVLEIEDLTFAECESVVEVVFESPSECKRIGDRAFYGCTALKRIILPESLESMGEACFYGCTSLVEIVFPQSIHSLPREVCSWCISLQKIEVSKSLKEIGPLAFAYCKSLAQINFPPGIERISNNAFSLCESLLKINLPSTIKELESYAFSDCISLQTVCLPMNSSMLGELIFSGCSSLTTIIELADTPPPFDCNSFIFEPDDTESYSRCVLIVPSHSEASYKSSHGWRLFQKIISRF